MVGIEYKHEYTRVFPIIAKKAYIGYMCVKRILFLIPEISAIPVQLYRENNLLRQKQDKSIVTTQIFQGYRLGKFHFSALLTLHKK